GLEAGGWGGVYLRFVMSFLILGIPCTLMGGTLPFMGRLALGLGKRDSSFFTDGVSAAFSLLYAMNTFGAALGSALTGFVLLRFLGMQHALWIAAAVNFAVAVGARLAAAGEAAGEPPVAMRISSNHGSDR